MRKKFYVDKVELWVNSELVYESYKVKPHEFVRVIHNGEELKIDLREKKWTGKK